MIAHLRMALAQCPRVFAIAALLVSSWLPPDAQEAAPGGQGAAAKEDSENTGADFTRPVNSLEVRFQYRPSSAPGSETGKEYAIGKLTTRIELEPGWKLALLAQTEGENKVTKNSSGTTQDAGLGDSTFQAALIHDFDKRWAAGVGLRVVAPLPVKISARANCKCSLSLVSVTPSLNYDPKPLSRRKCAMQ